VAAVVAAVVVMINLHARLIINPFPSSSSGLGHSSPEKSRVRTVYSGVVALMEKKPVWKPRTSLERMQSKGASGGPTRNAQCGAGRDSSRCAVSYDV
jgi:hypothetical protein